jgi:Zn-dependent protease with chaperone function
MLAFLWATLAPAVSQAALISRSTEISMGREAAQEFERTTSVDADPVLAARVQRIGNRLIAVGDTPPYPFEFHEVDTNEMNAFSLPGGFVYFFRGLAQLMPGDDALAFVMAHEISHVTQRHGIRQLEKSLAVGSLLNYTLGASTTSGVLELAIGMHYSRRDEAEADRLGLARMAKAGFDPSQGAEAMAVIERVDKGEHHIPAFLRDHPLTANRIAALRRQAAALQAEPHPAPQIAAGPPLPQPPDLPSPPTPVISSDLFPLTVGTRWTYRVTESGESNRSANPRAFTASVLEQTPDHPGVYRVRMELGDGLAATRLLAVTADGVYACRDGRRQTVDGARGPAPRFAPPPPKAGEQVEDEPGQAADGPASSPPSLPTTDYRLPSSPTWQKEIDLPASMPQEGANPTEETVHVPAGEYHAVRTVEHLPGGETATVWLAPGVGMVRRAWTKTGLVEELESISRPAPEQDRKEGSPKVGG